MVNLYSACKMTKKNSNSKILGFLTALFFVTALLPNLSFARDMTEFPRVKLQSLDKGTARTITFDAKVGSTIRFGPLYIRVQSCQKSSPIDQPESAAFLQIWEVDTNKEPQWVFSGWMFASSPGLSPMDHAIYDVWVLDCLDYDEGKKDVEASAEDVQKEQKEDIAEEEKPDETANENAAENQDLLEQ